MKRKHRLLKYFNFIVVMTGFFASSHSFGLDLRYSQMVFSFDRPIKYKYFQDVRDNSLNVFFESVRASELEAVHNYDESLVRRVLIRERSEEGTEIKLVLRDQRVRVTVTEFTEPYRVILDLYDKNYQEYRDPKSGIPLAQREQSELSAFAKSNSSSIQNSRTYGTPRDGQAEISTNGTIKKGEKRRLLQPQIPDINNSNQLQLTLKKIPPGIGMAWKDYPLYVYRIQTALYKVDKNYESWLAKNSKKAMTSVEAMAEYAGKLYDFGHEGRSLLAYQQVLYKSPAVFDQNAQHLWKLAEIHLGRNNHTLAQGYYESLLKKHRDSPLSQFARLRILDLIAIKKMRKNQSNLTELIPQLEKVIHNQHPELSALVAIRKSFWSEEDPKRQQQILSDRFFLPTVSEENLVELKRSEENVQGLKTAFLVASLSLNSLLLEDRGWSSEIGSYTDLYLKKYKGNSVEPIRSRLVEKSQNLLHQLIVGLENKKKFAEAVKVYEDLPDSLKKVHSSLKTAWAIAQSYRKLGSAEKSSQFYIRAQRVSNDSITRLRTSFWGSLMLGEALSNERMTSTNSEKISQLESDFKNSDRIMGKAWNDLGPKEKGSILQELKIPLEETVGSELMLVTPARMVLEAWSQFLSTNLATSENTEDLKKSYSPSVNTVFLVERLANKFSQLGMDKEKIQALALYRRLKPSNFKNDKPASEIWASKLVELAEDYRRANEYLKAGRTYTYAGKESIDWDYKAEALYKGGLLLFRAGRREEAIEAFTEASQDTNNLLYAELAKRRLDQFTN